MGQFPGERVHNSFPATLVVGGRVKIFFAPSGRLMVACQGLSDITSNLLKHTENTPLLSFAPVKCLISGKFHWAKQAIIDAVQKNEQKKTNLPETIYNKSGNWVSPRKRKQENVNKISEQKTSKSKIEKQNKNKK